MEYNKVLWIGSACLLLALPMAANAEPGGELTLRAGAGSLAGNYPFAYDARIGGPETSVVNAPFGSGTFSEVIFRPEGKILGYDTEHSVSFLRTSGSGAYGDPESRGFCGSFAVTDLISLSHALCMNGAETQSDNNALIAQSVVVSDQWIEGVDVIAGVGLLAFASESQGQMFAPSEVSVQLRQSGFEGTGIVTGARFEQPLGKMALNVEAQAGLYFGRRILEIADIYQGTIGELVIDEPATAGVFEVTAMVRRPVTIAQRETLLEFGVNVTSLFNVLDTANYNAASAGTGAQSPTGSISDSVTSVSVFAGVTIGF